MTKLNRCNWKKSPFTNELLPHSYIYENLQTPDQILDSVNEKKCHRRFSNAAPKSYQTHFLFQPLINIPENRKTTPKPYLKFPKEATKKLPPLLSWTLKNIGQITLPHRHDSPITGP